MFAAWPLTDLLAAILCVALMARSFGRVSDVPGPTAVKAQSASAVAAPSGTLATVNAVEVQNER
jgi:hypothetical protein